MEAKTPDEVLDPAKRRQAEEKLRELNFSEDDIRAAVKALTPRVSHKAQIRKIVVRLGLAVDGDTAKSWLSVCDVVGKAHQRNASAVYFTLPR